MLRQVDRALKGLDLNGQRTIDDIDANYRQQTQGLNIKELAHERSDKINKAIGAGDLAELLALIDNKGMLADAASCLKNTRRDEFEAWLVRSLLNDREPGLRKALLQALPTMPEA